MTTVNLRAPSASSWSYYPFRPAQAETADIYITRIVPGEHTIQVEWKTEDADKAFVLYRERGTGGDYIRTNEFSGGCAMISNLKRDCDYEFYLEDGAGRTSMVRLARTGDYIGVPIQYLHPDDMVYAFSGRYLCSPSIVRQPDGSLLASMDLYHPHGPQNLTLIYRSDDDGATWKWQCELFPCFWGKLFVFRGEVYMVSCSTEHGDMLIGKSSDGGKSFGTPAVIMRGSGKLDTPGLDMSPEPPVEYGGRLWVSFHYGRFNTPTGTYAGVASAPADSDILDPENWTISALVPYDKNWPGVAAGDSKGTLEGSFLVLPDGNLYILARYEIGNCEPDHGLALLYRVRTDDPAAPLEYVRTVPFEGNHSKFEVQRDEKTGWYYSIITRILGSEQKYHRNLLSLAKSPDGIHWTTVMDVIDLRDRDPKKNGLQYVDFFIEGDRIYYVCRTGVNEPKSFHDTNVTLFGTIENFRNY